jgi:hypothetical protein
MLYPSDNKIKLDRDESIQRKYNELFDLVGKRMHKVSLYDKFKAYLYHFSYLLGIAHRRDPARAENYGKVLGRAIRYLQSRRN